MVYLDANAFYWYYGREKLLLTSSTPIIDVGHLRIFLDCRKDKAITASALIEIIVHHRDNPQYIKDFFDFIDDKKIKIYNNIREYSFTTELSAILPFILKDLEQTKKYAYKLMEIKIQIEKSFAFVFLEIVSLMYADYYIKTQSDFEEETKEKVLSFLGRGSYKTFETEYKEAFHQALQDGYADNNKGMQYLKRKYMELLSTNCIISHIIVDGMREALSGEKDIYETMCEAAEKARRSGLTDSDAMNTIKNSLETDAVFLNEAKNKISNVFLQKGYTRYQSLYIKHMLSAWLERGQKLRKNDIFDMLCVGGIEKSNIDKSLNVLVDQSSYLLTFDKTMMSFLVEENVPNARFINEFLLSNHKIL